MCCEKMLLETIVNNLCLNAPTLSKRLGRSLRTTQRYLKKLSDKKQIVFKGVAKNGGYEELKIENFSQRRKVSQSNSQRVSATLREVKSFRQAQ